MDKNYPLKAGIWGSKLKKGQLWTFYGQNKTFRIIGVGWKINQIVMRWRVMYRSAAKVLCCAVCRDREQSELTQHI